MTSNTFLKKLILAILFQQAHNLRLQSADQKRGGGGDEGYTIYYDAYTPTQVPRTIVPDYPIELFYRYPKASQQGFEFKDGEVFIPSAKFLQAYYVMKYNSLDIEDVGVAKMQFLNNPIGVASDYIKFGMGEKMHNKKESKHTANAVTSEMMEGKRNWFINMVAKQFGKKRQLLLDTWLMKTRIGTQMFKASSDDGVVQSIRNYVVATNSTPNARQLMGFDMMDKRLSEVRPEMFDHQTVKQSLVSSLNCMHWENATVIPSKGAWLKMDQILTTFRAHTIQNTGDSSEMMGGMSMFHHDIEKDEVSLYYTATFLGSFGCSHCEKPDPPIYHVSPNDADSAPVPPDSRVNPVSTGTEKVVPSKNYQTMYKMLKMTPEDYSYLSRDPNVACPAEKLQKWTKYFAENPMSSLLKGKLPLSEILPMVMKASDAVDCGLDYLRPDKHQVASYQEIDAMVWLHTLIEGPPAPESAMDVAGARGWNVVDVAYL